MSDPVEIPWESLSGDALQGVIEEYVTREGTEYGLHEIPLERKVAQVRRQLERSEAQILFDPASGSCHIVPRDR